MVPSAAAARLQILNDFLHRIAASKSHAQHGRKQISATAGLHQFTFRSPAVPTAKTVRANGGGIDLFAQRFGRLIASQNAGWVAPELQKQYRPVIREAACNSCFEPAGHRRANVCGHLFSFDAPHHIRHARQRTEEPNWK